MAVFNLPQPLYPSAFQDRSLYKHQVQVPLYCALAASARFRLFPKTIENAARCDVPRFFGARYFSDDEQTAVSEFEHRWRGMHYRLWRGALKLRQCLDLADDAIIGKLQLGPNFLVEDPYFPWHYMTACALSAGCDSIAYRSFRGPGRSYAVFEADSIAQEFSPV